MLKKSNFKGVAGFVMVWIIGASVLGFSPDTQAAEKGSPQHSASSRHMKVKPDLSGHKRMGKASVFSGKLAGKKMADGQQ